MHAPSDFYFFVRNNLAFQGFLAEIITNKFINPEPRGLRLYFSRRVAIWSWVSNSWRLRTQKIVALTVSYPRSAYCGVNTVDRLHSYCSPFPLIHLQKNQLPSYHRCCRKNFCIFSSFSFTRIAYKRFLCS